MTATARANATASWQSRWGPWLATAVWLAVFAAGSTQLLRYQFTPGDETRAPLLWPRDSALALHPSGSTLLLFVHPHCSCTRASLDELQVVMSHPKAPLNAQAIFVQLPGFTDEEMKDETWERAGRVPGLERRLDAGGVEARRFAAVVSGYTVLYDAAGRLLFDGGITGSRGHVGANTGRNSVIGFLRDGRADVDRTRAFGCYLFDRAEHAIHHHEPHEV